MVKIIWFIVGGAFGFILSFPLGIMYTVQAADNSKLVKYISILKGFMETL